ncbi:hypothetical protein ACFYTQ_26505 [Nocardia sp. NPDC004068]|uniref:hypothetical protein n=1 Tax=Nocardia sp. NPDC004068 TaxID=3364303 RepID=UPI0036D0EBC0
MSDRTERASDSTGSDSTGKGNPMRIGPTSEETRRRVAESRVRQGLSPRIENPAVIESLARFLRNAIDTLEPFDQADQGNQGGPGNRREGR